MGRLGAGFVLRRLQELRVHIASVPVVPTAWPPAGSEEQKQRVRTFLAPSAGSIPSLLLGEEWTDRASGSRAQSSR